MIDREKVIMALHDARRYLENKEWSDRGASPHIDSINEAISLLKEQDEKIRQLRLALQIMKGNGIKVNAEGR